ncbi:MAG: flavodoxin-dependent (E)-4-hydroxy-3-methylbut-2-enyl-diphosphate synthase [Candidatus Omnitrophica bacterium]|nr:flavodoxin-dependent (E)-4-hydroxy-3-methylbut-2-enyl-diphosphate synthase [Candidatus Omnitrophota bacterium]
MLQRRKTRTVSVGGLKMGSEHPVSIQSMTKTDTRDVLSTVKQIRQLEKAGCELVRVAVKDMDSARAIGEIKKQIGIPLIADIHFDHRLAIESVKRGSDKIRINPGNITKREHIEAVIDACMEAGLPIRVGINSGSIGKMAAGKGATAHEMVEALQRYLEPFRKKGFGDLIISLKASSVLTTVESYRMMASLCDYPFHIGVTAAGPPSEGIIRSSIGIGSLLLDGIGDTIRVSLTGSPLPEVDAAKRILAAVGARSFGHSIISCPTCGRCQVDLAPLVEKLQKEVEELTARPLTIAIMGCEVNGPGEAGTADIGIAFGRNRGAIFRDGEIIKTVRVSEAVEELVRMIKEQITDGPPRE